MPITGRTPHRFSPPDQLEVRQRADAIRGFFVQRQPVVQAVLQRRQREVASRPDLAPQRGDRGPEIGR